MITIHDQKAIDQMKHVLLQLRTHAHDKAIDDQTGNNVDALVAAGAISTDSATFIRSEGVRFYGFSSNRMADDVRVLEMDLATWHLVGTSGGAVVRSRK